MKNIEGVSTNIKEVSSSKTNRWMMKY